MPHPSMYHHRDQPRLRATIDGNRLQTVFWNPYLSQITAAEAEDLKRSRLTMAHLWREGSEGRWELAVEWLVPPANPSLCPVPLRDWARCIGYVRLWLPDAPPLELDRVEAPLVPQTPCDWCAWEPGPQAMELWQQAQEIGAFPPQCPRCGSHLPQWVSHPVEIDDDLDPGFQIQATGDDPLSSEKLTPDPEEAR